MFLHVSLFADSHVFSDAYHEDDEDDGDDENENSNTKSKKTKKSKKNTVVVGSDHAHSEADGDDDGEDDEDEHTVHIDASRMTRAERMAHERAGALSGAFLRCEANN